MDGYTFDQEFWSDGVRPVGQRVLADILATAFKELGVAQPNAEALMK
jgi:hypothetical protein